MRSKIHSRRQICSVGDSSTETISGGPCTGSQDRTPEQESGASGSAALIKACAFKSYAQGAAIIPVQFVSALIHVVWHHILILRDQRTDKQRHWIYSYTSGK